MGGNVGEGAGRRGGGGGGRVESRYDPVYPYLVIGGRVRGGRGRGRGGGGGRGGGEEGGRGGGLEEEEAADVPVPFLSRYSCV